MHSKNVWEPKNRNIDQSGPAEKIRLNRYIAMSGRWSRREADQLVFSGRVKVNGKTATSPAVRVVPGRDEVQVDGKTIHPANEKVYILLNKPKDVITTRKDERRRKTVMDLLPADLREMVFPVGRLDRQTTGLILLTNDGSLAHALTHPSSRVEKIYRVRLNKPITRTDLQKLVEGVPLEDGLSTFDEAAILDEEKKMLGVRLHSGRNRIIRRTFKALGYEVTHLDRTAFAGLTKKKLPRGHWRHLTPREVKRLFGQVPKTLTNK